ncbi:MULTISPECIES: alpha/beta hydrolase fold domain-containing protein [unclassified Geodermatophilus]|uniref:alpha/beta hydrolase fold domain-containing protein n=1 Tax=unclassified Geodermatophilus TaxID=2637632 RepID=UPI003EEF1267
MPAPAFPLPPPAHAAPLPRPVPGPGGTPVLLGLPYAAIPGIRPLELDLHLPAGGPAPVVVFLHGGGWRLGSRRAAGPAFPGSTLFEQVAAAGIAVASVDYRLSGEAVWPAQLHDAKAAVRWLRARAGELGVDGDRVAAWGESAGGHLAVLLGLTAGDALLEGELGLTGPSSAVAAVAAWYPPTDLAGLPSDAGADPTDPATREAQLLGAPAVTVPDIAAQASPVTHVSAAAPPSLLLHGEADRLIPCVQSERLAGALRAAGADVELHTYPGADHMWLGAPDAARDAADRTIAFLQHHLTSEGEQP